MDNIRWCIDEGIHCVVGTTGFDAERIATVRRWVERGARGRRASIAPNFGIGAVLMMRFAEAARPLLRVGRDHRAAPPGQGRRAERHRARTAELVAAARAEAGVEPAPDATTDGAGRRPRRRASTGVPVHSVRLAGLVAHQEVLLGTAGETLTLRHDSLRPGLVHAGRAAGGPLGRGPARAHRRSGVAARPVSHPIGAVDALGLSTLMTQSDTLIYPLWPRRSRSCRGGSSGSAFRFRPARTGARRVSAFPRALRPAGALRGVRVRRARRGVGCGVRVVTRRVVAGVGRRPGVRRGAARGAARRPRRRRLPVRLGRPARARHGRPGATSGSPPSR